MYTRNYWIAILAAVALTAPIAAHPRNHYGYRRQNGVVPPGTISDCTYFVDTVPGDTCASIASDWGLTPAQFLSYNPSVKSNCSGLVIGDSYCIEENNGNGPAVPTSTATTTSAASTNVTSPPTTTTAAGGVPSPTQSGLAANCNAFYKVQPNDFCQMIVDIYGTFTLSDFYTWNPAVGTNCGGLQANVFVCVGVPGTPTARPSSTTTTAASTGPSPTQEGIVSTCNAYYKAISGDTCTVIASKYSNAFSVAEFESWNPAVGPTCASLFLDYFYCVGVNTSPTSPSPTTTTTPVPTPTSSSSVSPTQTGIVSNCNAFYQAVSGDTCAVIAAKFNTFTVATFEEWNPAVGPTCSGLFLGYYYCIGTTTSPTTTIASPTASPTPNGPQPQQPGIVGNCNKFYKVKSGDGCAAIETSQGISDAAFRKWNTEINMECSNLFLDYYVCVGAPSS